MKPADPARQEQKAHELRRMKRIPLLLLILMVILFAVTLDHPAAWAAWLHAFSEAGMVGALADWFAVVALFRHPLGIPIPHTAIIPTRKNELGDAMARFIDDHFLDPGVVRAKLDSVNLAGLAIDWLNSDKGRANIVDLATATIRWTLEALDEARVKRFLSRLGEEKLSGVSLAPFAGHTVDWLVRNGHHQQLLTQVMRYGIVVINENRENIRQKVQQESPWWIPGFIDDHILKQMLERIETQMFEITLDEQHPMRAQYHHWLERLALNLRTSPEHLEFGEGIKKQILENDSLRDYLFGLWHELSERLGADLQKPHSRTRERIGDWLVKVSGDLESNQDLQQRINFWIGDAIVLIVEKNSRQISSLISDTVRSWDGEDTSRRVELAIGSDLQYIRINGTLVGGLVGLLIHALSLV